MCDSMKLFPTTRFSLLQLSNTSIPRRSTSSFVGILGYGVSQSHASHHSRCYSFPCEWSVRSGIGHIVLILFPVQYHFPLFSFTGVHTSRFRYLRAHRPLCLARQSVGCYLGFLSFVSFTRLLLFIISLILCDDQAGGWGLVIWHFFSWLSVLVLEQLLEGVWQDGRKI